MRVLFILKRNETYGFNTYTRRSSGLWNSTKFIVESLSARGIHAHIVEVLDNNDIDRVVTRSRPDVVIIEALWVVPEKFEILKKLHPNVKWLIHMHSGTPFLALEGIATEWLRHYYYYDIGIIANSKESYEAIKGITKCAVHYLPNVYLSAPLSPIEDHDLGGIRIGCFGAIRPMKNHLMQAIAALKFGEQKDKFVRFYINGSRVETGGEPCLKNLRKLFEANPRGRLHEMPWMEPEEFITFLHNEIDIGMQCSMTETFNVVNADYVTAGVPSVVSREITWASHFNKVKHLDVDEIVRIMNRVYRSKGIVKWNQVLLLSN